ncbi:methylated-DNA--[protein]-cysteine S-methyltransferase, partial [bacterium]|nr:methylated-DNA--[protein]-cysteine S-methyltransferase [bacterium]
MKTPLGKLRLVANDEGLTRVDFSDVLTAPESECVETKILQQAKKELTEYFAGVRTHF